MQHEEAGESNRSTRRREAPLHSSIYQTSAKYLPPYGAQHRQDALWEGEQLPCDTYQLTGLELGGNEALPPMWQQYKTSSDNETQYQDDTLVITSWNRPLNIDDPGDLVVPGWEWHISPLGWSYFVDHNTRTTSWKKPKPKCPAGSLMLDTSGNIMSVSLNNDGGAIFLMVVSQDETMVMCGSADGRLRLWNIKERYF